MIPLAIYNETRKGLLLIWDYKFSMLTQIVMFGLIFIGITFMIGGGRLIPEQMPGFMIGYLVWFFASLALNDMSWNLMEETRTGTLEQMYMSPAPTSVVVLGRAVARLMFTTAMVGSMGLLLITLLDVPLHFNAKSAFVFIITLLGLYGYGFAMAGGVLVFKQIGSLAGLLQNLLLFLNGSLLPIDKMPGWLAAVAKTLPTTQGIVVLRKVIIGDESLISVWRDGSLQMLTLQSISYFLLGLILFYWCETIAKRKGTLGQY